MPAFAVGSMRTGAAESGQAVCECNTRQASGQAYAREMPVIAMTAGGGGVLGALPRSYS